MPNSRGVFAPITRGFDDLRVSSGAGDLEAGKRLLAKPAGDSVEALGMPNLDEVPGGIGTFHRPGPNPVACRSREERSSGIGGNVDALDPQASFRYVPRSL